MRGGSSKKGIFSKSCAKSCAPPPPARKVMREVMREFMRDRISLKKVMRGGAVICEKSCALIPCARKSCASSCARSCAIAVWCRKSCAEAPSKCVPVLDNSPAVEVPDNARGQQQVLPLVLVDHLLCYVAFVACVLWGLAHDISCGRRRRA